MKSVLLLALLLALAACNTTSNRRELYSPARAHGKWTQKERGLTLAGRYDHRSQTTTYTVWKKGTPPPSTMPAVEPSTPLPGAALPAE